MTDKAKATALQTAEGVMKYLPVIAGLFFLFNIYRDVQDLKKREGDNYTISQASEDALREAIANPGHRVPDPRSPGEYIVAGIPR